MAKYKTDWIKPDDIERKWHIVDVADQVLGRASTQIAALLIGKHKVEQVPNLDVGDYVVVINSSKVALTRGKESKKMYYRHSGYPGGLKEIPFERQMKKNSNFVIEQAVKNMLPHTKLQSSMMNRLFVYKGDTHKHTAQKPTKYVLKNNLSNK
jgi:large subunit ribosomal protein L13